MNTQIDIIKLKTYRDKLFQEDIWEGIERRKTWTKEEEELGNRIFDHIFSMGMFAGVNIILHNPDFQLKEQKEKEQPQ